MNRSLSEIHLPDNCLVVFDLDDTLYTERDFVRSGFRAVTKALGVPVFDRLMEEFDAGNADPIGSLVRETNSPLSPESLLTVYREHQPNICLTDGALDLLKKLREIGHSLGLLTDGRSSTQRNKIESLGILDLFDEIVISGEFGSEKPDERNFRHFELKFQGREYVYVGDNLEKDFVSPNRLGWLTVCLLDRGYNRHSQHFGEVEAEFLPSFTVQTLL